MVLVDEAAAILTQVTLTPTEYLETIRRSSRAEARSGIVYDALLVAAARKSKADRIYTWNIKHFLRIAPELADRIRTP